MGFEAPRDAYAVAEAVSRCGDPGLVRQWALIGEAPDWTPEPVITWEKGSPIWGRWEKKRRLRIVGYHVFAHGDVPAIVDERRSVYRRWAIAVAKVHGMLAEPGVLHDHQLAGAPAPLTPWENSGPVMDR